ncbi:hypothetical protein [Micromonospora echinofusca]|uniref:Uncharacterized protein n=1 Tax=Micromonospora echinofusca TaxID=47858 RepID=A0ABS3VT53_MICEH|nr:hypothetical protein [Micromonospora echinofusca]MBO4207717.1 hypothetical protein [Micromonospora echinofusca]
MPTVKAAERRSGPRAGDVVCNCAAVGVPFGGASAFDFRGIHVDDEPSYCGWRWVEGCKSRGDNIEHRLISVRLAGLRLVRRCSPGGSGLRLWFARSPGASTYPPPLRCSCLNDGLRNGTCLMAYQPGPNELLRAARLALRSPSGSGRPLSRQELAEAVNSYLYEHVGRRFAIYAGYVGTLERGQTRWPSVHYRTALRAVLGKAKDAELGFFIIRGHANDPDVAPVEPPPPAVLSQAALPDLHTATPPAAALRPTAMPGVANGGPGASAEAASVQVSVNGDAAVTVVCHEAGPADRVAVVAGPVRVLIDPGGADPASLAPPVVTGPMVVGGARVYPIAQRRQQR